jgi:tRNA A-37 threonylcarbamoyl transferase component Bud32
MPESGTPSAPSASTQQLLHPSDFPQIPGHRLLRRLGQGGMATVYLAMQESLDRPVSIKVMERDALADETSKSRFEHEARTIAKLTHPCIVNIYEVGRTADGRMYYIMPYLPNGDLAQRDLSNNEARIVEVLRALLSALGYAHARGIVHRDVKEENVLFDAADRPLLTDFGIALSRRDTSRITTAGLAVGSSGYMAPEQARGDEVDGRADLYSVGVLAFELLTGDLPYRSADPLALALMHAQKPVPRLPPSKRHWQAFIDRAMAKTPVQRFRNAQQMQHALDRIGRRTGSHFGSRILRKFDHAIEGKIWKRPIALAVCGVVLIAAGLFLGRDRLPRLGAHAAAATRPVVAASPTSSPVPAPAHSATLAPAHVAAIPTAPSAAHASTPAPAGTMVKPPVASVVAQPQPQPTAPVVPTPPTAAPAVSIAPDAAVLSAAHDAIAHGNLTSPAGDSAIDLSMMAWKLSPASADTHKLVTDVLTALSAQEVHAIVQNRDQRVQDYQKRAAQLASATIGDSAPAWRTFQISTANALAHRAAQATIASDAAALARTDALAKQMDLSDVYARAKTKEIALAQAQAKTATPAPTAQPSPQVVAAAGAGYVVLHAPSSGHPGAALSHSEVTRHEYAQFVNATRRPASQCMSHKFKLFSALSDRVNWTQPGFEQSAGDPVVCVSWNDANAYVQWLNSQGGHYRLPNIADWHEAGLAGGAQSNIEGSFSNWLQDCASGCQNHLVTGRSWREHKPASPIRRPGDLGHDDVGFRVVREIGGHN